MRKLISFSHYSILHIYRARGAAKPVAWSLDYEQRTERKWERASCCTTQARANCYGEGAVRVHPWRPGVARAVDQPGRYVAMGAELGAFKICLAAWLWSGLLRYRND